MLRRYVNKKNKQKLVIKESEIKKTVRIINMLMVPQDFKTILDERITFLSNEELDIKDLEGFVFIDKEDLTSDLIGLFKFYYGSLSLFLYDEFLEKRPDLLENHTKENDTFKKIIIEKLEIQFEDCMKKKVYPNQFLVKESYQDIVLYDPQTPTYKDKWELKEKIKTA